jgi:hypothetical protein
LKPVEMWVRIEKKTGEKRYSATVWLGERPPGVIVIRVIEVIAEKPQQGSKNFSNAPLIQASETETENNGGSQHGETDKE